MTKKSKIKQKTSKKAAPKPPKKSKAKGSSKSKVVMADQTGYCVRCGEKKVIEDPERVMVGKDKDRPALKGECPDCGTTVMRFLKRDA